jgi:serine/threonine protein kinase
LSIDYVQIQIAHIYRSDRPNRRCKLSNITDYKIQDQLSLNISMTTVYCTKGHENQDSNRFCQICGEKLNPPVPPTSLAAGNVLEDRYRIVQQIGQGGFGRTYLCENLTRFNEPCVLKEFAPQVQGTYALDKAKTLFEREASVLHNLTHPQIPRFRELFELKTGSRGLFLVQDYVAGQTYRYLLAARQNQHHLFTEDEIRKLLTDTLPVLEYIHSLGVIHRDIAPDNLMLRSSDNLPVLIDFGGVKQIAVNAEIQATGNTEVPTCLGKIGYAPYEQMQRGTVSANSDLYALAATCLVLLTGKEPTELIDPQSLSWNWRSAINLESNLSVLFDRMLQPNPANRYQSASEVLRVLKQQAATPQLPITQPPAPTNKSMVETVVVAPGVDQKQVNTNTISGAENDSSFLNILGRSWMVILGLGTVGTIIWVGSNIFFNKPTPPTPTPAASSSPSTPSSTATPLTKTSPSSTTASSPEAASNSRNISTSDRDLTGKSSSNQQSDVGKRSETVREQTGNTRPPKEVNTNLGSSSSRREPSTRNRARLDTGNKNTPTISNSSEIDNEPSFKLPPVQGSSPKPRPPKASSEEQPASKPPKIEGFDIEPRPSKVSSDKQPVPTIEGFDVKPRPSKVSSGEQLAPKIEGFDLEPRRQSASKPNTSDKPAKKPAKKTEPDNEQDPLF